MCALTKTILPEFGATEPKPASAINFDVLKDLARLDGHREQHGSLLGTSAVTALLLQELVSQVNAIACEIKGMKIDSSADKDKPTGSTGDAVMPKPASAAVAGSRFGVVATVDAASVQAISGGVGAVLAQTVHQPLTEIRGSLKTLGDGLGQADAAQKADRGRLDTLEPKADATASHVAALQKTAEEMSTRLDHFQRALHITTHQMLKLHGTVGGLGGDVAGFAEMTEAVERHVEALGIGLAIVASEIPPPDKGRPGGQSGSRKQKS
jgi:hypothetical protein